MALLRTLTSLALTVGALLGIVPSACSAAEPGPAAGSRVRFFRPSGQWQLAELVSLAGDTLVVARSKGAAPDTLRLGSLGALDICTGKAVRRKRVLVGLIAGGLVGEAIGAHINEGRCTPGEPCGWQLDFHGLGGAILGLAVGCIPVDRWERLYASPAPVVGRLGSKGSRSAEGSCYSEPVIPESSRRVTMMPLKLSTRRR